MPGRSYCGGEEDSSPLASAMLTQMLALSLFNSATSLAKQAACGVVVQSLLVEI